MKVPPTVAELVDRGKIVYLSNCIACHNSDPKQQGSVGPDVAGSSKALLEARILLGEYPSGYKPKRETHLMKAIPSLKFEIDAIYSFLNR